MSNPIYILLYIIKFYNISTFSSCFSLIGSKEFPAIREIYRQP
nr:MAG TPA: hypothetical protein [Caudoviricetes sp.]